MTDEEGREALRLGLRKAETNLERALAMARWFFGVEESTPFEPSEGSWTAKLDGRAVCVYRDDKYELGRGWPCPESDAKRWSLGDEEGKQAEIAILGESARWRCTNDFVTGYPSTIRIGY